MALFCRSSRASLNKCSPILNTVLQSWSRPCPIHQEPLWISHQLVRHFSKRDIKRFYKNVTISQHDGHFEINLDRKKLKTPMGKVLRVPTEGLALVVASEWDRQKDILQQSTMYFTHLCNKSIDIPLPQSSVERAEDILQFLETDTVRFRVEEPEDLVQFQTRAWDPVITWVEDRHLIKIGSTNNIFAPAIPTHTKEIIARFLTSYDSWSLTGLQQIVEALKSVVLALALLERHVSVETAVALSRLEEEYQIGQWGKVEWAHDMELMHLQSSIAASLLFIRFNTEVDIVHKKVLPHAKT